VTVCPFSSSFSVMWLPITPNPTYPKFAMDERFYRIMSSRRHK
jgi:hypothetical protein